MTVEAFWTTSGRIDSFEFEKVSANDYEKSLGYMTGIKGGSLTFGFDTDLKVSGSLDISSSEYFENCIIRVHYKPRFSESEKKDIVLATCFAYVNNMEFDKGRYTGSIELVSTLARYTDDILQGGFAIGKNKTYKNELARLFAKESTGGKYRFLSGVTDKINTTAIAFEQGQSVMEVAQAVADGLEARIDVDEYGTTIFEKYIAPSKKPCVLKLPTGKYSVTLPKVGIEENNPEMPNRVAYHCELSWVQEVYVLDEDGNKRVYTSGENKGKYMTKLETLNTVITGKAQVDRSSPLHYNKRGRWVTQTFTYQKSLSALKVNSTEKLDEQLALVKKEADNKAASKLSSLITGNRKYMIECFYLPLKCGQVVEFEYVSSGMKLHVQAMVMNVEINLSVGAKMAVTLKHVRYV